MTLDDLLAPPTAEPRRPTRWERLVYTLTGRYPQSYVAARLDVLEADRREMDRRLARWAAEKEDTE